MAPPGGVRVLQRAGVRTRAHRLDVLERLGQRDLGSSRPPGSQQARSWMRALALVGPARAAPACRWTSRRASRRRPRWRKPTSAPSGWTSAQANGGRAGASASARGPTPTWRPCPPGPTSTISVRSSPVMRVVLGRRHEHPAVGALDPQQDLLAQAGEEGADHRTGRPAERVLDDEGRAEHPRVVGHCGPLGLEGDDLADDLAALHGVEGVVDLVELDAAGDHARRGRASRPSRSRAACGSRCARRRSRSSEPTRFFSEKNSSKAEKLHELVELADADDAGGAAAADGVVGGPHRARAGRWPRRSSRSRRRR